MTTKSEPLTVVVAGGGPVGLTFSLTLAMMMGEDVKIQIYEGRWFANDEGIIAWQGEAQGKNRRDQVVTLQDHVINQLPRYVQDGLFSRINERVWPTSRNIPIREVEDRLFDLIQPFVSKGQVELIPENLQENSQCLVDGTYDILVGTDGAGSFVRRYCKIQMISEGLEYACGVAYNIPDKVNETDEPLHQALNCVLTVSQTRYLVNSSTSRRGYLNIRLIKDEYEALQNDLESFRNKNQTLDLLDYSIVPQSPVWLIIRQGLTFFKIPAKYVFRVVPIEINVRHASIVVRELRFEIKQTDPKHSDQKKYKTMLAFLAGDAAMNVHFWPGRGMNSGMKAAMALARNILRSCTANGHIQIRRPLRFIDFLDYEGFMARLRAREQQGRSLRVLIDPIDPAIEAGYSYAHLSHCYKKYSQNLVSKLKQTSSQLEGRSDWPHKDRKVTDEDIEAVTKRIDPTAVAQLSLANPWPTREMSGQEILVEDAYPFDLSKYLSAPSKLGTRASVQRPLRIPCQQYWIVLWVTGNRITPSMTQLIDEVKSSGMFRKPANPNRTANSLITFEQASDAKSWLHINANTIKKPDVLIKIVTAWRISNKETAIDVIRIIRSQLPNAPIQIFTSDSDEKLMAIEFLNVTIATTEREVKEFVNADDEGQWGPGYAVSCRATSSSTSSKPSLIWFDTDDNDVQLIDELKKSFPTLRIKFTKTFQGGEDYVKANLADIRQRKLSTIFILRGYYREENKTCMDAVTFLEQNGLESSLVVIYTRSRESVVQRYPQLPRSVHVTQKREELRKMISNFLPEKFS